MIEVVREGSLYYAYFPKPRMCDYLTRKSRQDLVWGVSRATAAEKIEARGAAAGDAPPCCTGSNRM